MTLIEMLVATTVTLILMAAIGQVFSTFGRSVSGSRAALDMNARMRTVAWRLRQDLAGTTAPTLPPLDPADGLGYFEVIEGPLHDTDAGNNSNMLAADIDDVLLFTTKAGATPFRGVFLGQTIESNFAEIAWFARPTVPATTPATYTVYRKQMLVVGYVGTGPFNAAGARNSVAFATFGATAATAWRTVYDSYDLSVSRRGNAPGMLVPNTLTDLTKREYRFMHNYRGDVTGLPVVGGGQFPYVFASGTHMASLPGISVETLPPGLELEGLVFDASSPRLGDDVVLTNVVAFDVRVFDPAAPLANSPSGNDVVGPRDDTSPFPAAPTANGAYVDLGNQVMTVGPSGESPRFAGFGSPLSRLLGSSTTACVYDTWSTHYEADGVDQDGVAGVDQGVNGADDQVPARLGLSPVPADGVIDDVDEWETKPPYPYPLRGIEVRIRCFEPSSRQVRQVTVRHTFVPH